MNILNGSKNWSIIYDPYESQYCCRGRGTKRQLFALSLMSYTFSGPRGYSEIEFIPDEEWNLGYFITELELRDKCICFSADYVSGRMMKTDMVFESGGKVTLSNRNRGRGADRWLTHLQGKRHISEA